MLLFSNRALLAATNQSHITIETTTCMHRNRKPYNSFFMANKVSDVDHVRVLPATPTQWNMVANYSMQPWLNHTYDIENPCYGQLTAVKTRCLLTSM